MASEQKIISSSHRENQNVQELKESLDRLLELRRKLYIDHPWSE